MLDEQEMQAVAKHQILHRPEMDMCRCPCFAALIKVGEKIAEERELMKRMGSVSPMALAAIIGSDLTHLGEDDVDD